MKDYRLSEIRAGKFVNEDRNYRRVLFKIGDLLRGFYFEPHKSSNVEELEQALFKITRAATRMETLYKLKCNELKTIKQKTAKEILQKWYDEDKATEGDMKDYILEVAFDYDVEVDE